MTSMIPNGSIKADGKVYLFEVADDTKLLIEVIFTSPEALLLKTLVENNPWHDKENVYSHILTVFANIQALLTFDFVKNPTIKKEYKKYFSETPKSCTASRLELLLIACSLHDLGKGVKRPKDDKIAPGKTYLFTLDDGITKGTDHGHASALLSKKILKKANLTTGDKDYIYYLIDNHDFYNKNYCEENLTFKPDKDAEILKKSNDCCLELLLHIIADEYGAEITKKFRSYLLKDLIAKNNLTCVD